MDKVPPPYLQAAKKLNLASISSSELLNILNDTPFWIWDPVKHQDSYEKKWSSNLERGCCCFWHTIGLPVKEHLVGRLEPTEEHPDGVPVLKKIAHPMYDYEKIVIEPILDIIPTAVLKAAGLGITSLILGLMSWLTMKDDTYYGQSFGVVTGPRIDIAKEEISRIPKLFHGLDYHIPQVEAEVTLNHCDIRAYPSHTFDAARGLDDIRFFFSDEGDFYPPGQQVKSRDVLERYQAKTHPMLAVVSTPNMPGGLMDKIFNMESESIYKKIAINYEWGLGKIYTDFEIEEAMKSPSFQSSYRCWR